ncbi:hypothetical protein DYB34_001808 [Aphanomyces astaci]|uniref:Protein kinase domain-containing protein n=1 Tax=Aphanomyces astaci TaxID=112090 RepID=A0A418B5K1_APHAT|nr:hypothetical protein DYB34_001808 [Aphanomyces astaci]
MALPKRRDIILLRLHHMLADRQECLESWLLHAFQKLDSVRSNDKALLETTSAHSMLVEDGRFRYMRFIWFVLPPGKMFIREDKTIGLHGIFQVSKGSWGVGHVSITIKRLEMNQQTLELTILAAFGRMSEPTIRRYVIQVIEGLMFLHANNILHKYEFSVGPALRALNARSRNSNDSLYAKFPMNPRDRATAEELTLHPFFQLEQDTKGT